MTLRDLTSLGTSQVLNLTEKTSVEERDLELINILYGVARPREGNFPRVS